LYTLNIMETSPILSTRSDIKYVFYINLDNRPDRKIHIENELHNLGINPTAIRRFRAIEMAEGAIGCSLSHLRCIQHAKNENLPYIMVVEDDFKILDVTKFSIQFDKLLQTHTDWDVVLLAGNNVGPYTILSDCAVKINQCQTTTGYLVKREYYDTLIENFTTGLRMLMKTPNLHIHFAIDRYWFNLQSKDNWLLVYPLYGTQCSNYSNIEKRYTNYDGVMLVLDKFQIQKKHNP